MKGYLDIHSHVLPGVDDGSKDMDMTMELLQMAYDEGVRYMMATPHYYPGHRNAGCEKLIQTYQEVKKEIQKQGMDMELFLGNEIYYKDEVPQLLRKKEIFTLNDSRYVLVEFNVNMEYKKINEAIKRLVMEGYYPIIAHVERYGCLLKREDLVQELIEQGAYIQVNAETFLGGMFDGYKKFVMKLFAKGMVHFLGSDAHRTDWRRPVMEEAVSLLYKKMDASLVDKVVKDNPKHFLEKNFIK